MYSITTYPDGSRSLTDSGYTTHYNADGSVRSLFLHITHDTDTPDSLFVPDDTDDTVHRHWHQRLFPEGLPSSEVPLSSDFLEVQYA